MCYPCPGTGVTHVPTLNTQPDLPLLLKRALSYPFNVSDKALAVGSLPKEIGASLAAILDQSRLQTPTLA